MAEVMNVENDTSARRAAFLREYNRRPEVMERNRKNQIDLSHVRKLQTTKKRFIEHSLEELTLLAIQRCDENHVDYETHKEAIDKVLRILHGS
jgi:hypothetical protein